MSKIIQPKELTELELEKSYLLLINPSAIPHLVLIHKNKYYALTYKESVLGRDFLPYFESLKRTKKPMFFLELRELDQDPLESFEKYEQAGLHTCFQPIKETICPDSSADFIFELVPDLYADNKIVQAFNLNAAALLDEEGNFQMNSYSKHDIYTYIESLKEKNVERIKGIS